MEALKQTSSRFDEAGDGFRNLFRIMSPEPFLSLALKEQNLIDRSSRSCVRNCNTPGVLPLRLSLRMSLGVCLDLMIYYDYHSIQYYITHITYYINFIISHINYYYYYY